MDELSRTASHVVRLIQIATEQKSYTSIGRLGSWPSQNQIQASPHSGSVRANYSSNEAVLSCVSFYIFICYCAYLTMCVSVCDAHCERNRWKAKPNMACPSTSLTCSLSAYSLLIVAHVGWALATCPLDDVLALHERLLVRVETTGGIKVASLASLATLVATPRLMQGFRILYFLEGLLIIELLLLIRTWSVIATGWLVTPMRATRAGTLFIWGILAAKAIAIVGLTSWRYLLVLLIWVHLRGHGRHLRGRRLRLILEMLAVVEWEVRVLVLALAVVRIVLIV